MGILQDRLDQEVQRLPRLACETLVNEKLKTLGLSDPALTEKVVAHILDGAFLEVDEDSPLAQLAFYDGDLERVDQISAAFINNVKSVIDNMSGRIADGVFSEIKGDWRGYDEKYQKESVRFNRRIRERWELPLSSLRLPLEISRDIGQKFFEAHSRSRLKRDRARNEALVRLHNRSCQTTAEIICLLEGGFPEGAYARWRTLLELMVYAVLIREGGDPLAERFLAYEAVERNATINERNRHADLMGDTRASQRETDATQKEVMRLKRGHGDTITDKYGWASGQLGLPLKPDFRKLQEVAGSALFRLDYKIASFGVHATPQASTTYSLLDFEIRSAGATNAGLDIAGANAVHTLTRINSTLMNEPWDLDKVILARALLLLRDETCRSFHQIARKLERDELKVRRDLERQALGHSARIKPVKLRMATRRG